MLLVLGLCFVCRVSYFLVKTKASDNKVITKLTILRRNSEETKKL